MKKQKIVGILFLIISIMIIFVLSICNIIKVESEKSIYWTNLGRGIGMELIQENNGVVNNAKISDGYRKSSAELGYVLITRFGHKIDVNNHDDLPWAIYIQTKNNLIRSLFHKDISVLAVRDDLSVYEMKNDEISKTMKAWN